MQASVGLGNRSLKSLVNTLTQRSYDKNNKLIILQNSQQNYSNYKRIYTAMFVHSKNCCFHCNTLALLIQRITEERLIVVIAVTPVKDFPAPHGKTIIPDRARPLPNILDKDFS